MSTDINLEGEIELKDLEIGCHVKYIHVFYKFIHKPTKKETASNTRIYGFGHSAFTQTGLWPASHIPGTL